jgi:hypothetical protein
MADITISIGGGEDKDAPRSSGKVEEAARKMESSRLFQKRPAEKYSPEKGRFEPLDEKVDSRLLRPDKGAPMGRGDDYYETKDAGRMERKATRRMRNYSR